MSAGKGRPEASRWLDYAREDIETAEALEREGGISRHVCWLSQQGAEKALKSILVAESVDFPRTHDLDALRNLIPARWKITAAFPDLAELSEWAVESRYPGNWPEATDQDSASAVDQARDLLDCISSDMEQHGFLQDGE